MPTMTMLVRGAVLLLAMAATFPVDAGQDPATVDVDGHAFALRAKATRTMVLGTIALYSIGIYTPSAVTNVERLRGAAVAKAVRIAVLYDGSMPSKVPSDWWNELTPALRPDQEQALKTAFEKLTSGEDVWVIFQPGHGTRIRRSGNTVVTTTTGELMQAVLDLFVGKTPVSQDVQDELLRDIRNAKGS